MKFEVIKNRPIRVGLVGCGRISKNHFDSIKYFSSDLDLVAICDRDFSSLSNAKAVHNVTGYDEISRMISNEKLDLIVLCTPSGLHSKQTIIAANAGINVMTEKPMATKYADGLSMVDACEKANVRLFVVKQNRFNSTLTLLKRAVDERRFGRIKMVNLNVFWTRPQEYYDAGGGWRGTWEYDGGAFMNQASHYVDLLEWLVGPIDCVQAMTSTSRDIEAEDTGVLNIRWRNGALGSMAVTMLTYPKNLEGSITILGEKGTVKIGGVAVNDIQTWEFSDSADYDSEIYAANYETSSVYGFGHSKYYKNVIDVLRGVADPVTDGREGLKSLEVLTAAYMSARDRSTVGLPLKL